MFEIVFLGTSASAPSIHRGLPAVAVLAGEHRFLVDCGEGTQRQILKSGIGYKRLNRILLTHSHLDHILGLGGLVSTFVHWESIEDLHIWGGLPTLDRVNALLDGVVLPDKRYAMPIYYHPIEQAGTIFEGKNFSISAFPVIHRGSGCFGFIFQEKSHFPFLVDQADALGVPVGPERGRLVAGESVTLADGRVIRPEMVLGKEIPGIKLVFTGDVARTNALIPYVSDADVLVIEATFLNSEQDVAQSYGHITAEQAAVLAKETGVKNLLLTHLSRRYRESDIIHEARQVFPEAVVARDFDHFVLRRGKPYEKKTASYLYYPEEMEPGDG